MTKLANTIHTFDVKSISKFCHQFAVKFCQQDLLTKYKLIVDTDTLGFDIKF